MRLPALLLSLLPTATFAIQAEPPRYLELVNHAQQSLVSLQVAAHGEAAYSPLLLEGPLRGGGESQIVPLQTQACRCDLRFGFADGRVMRYENVNVCRYGKVRIRPLGAGTEDTEYVVRMK